MANIPGASKVAPGVFTDIVTANGGTSPLVGTRIVAIIGTGERNEVIVASAAGGGQDGLNSSYTSTVGADGRHFLLQNAPIVEGRTKLYKNGTLLTGHEETISGSTFSYLYDYRVDPATGEIELQTARLVDQGGAYYVPGTANVGLGAVNNLELTNENAVTETWTVKCVDVTRDGYGSPIAGTGKFIAYGSVSGIVLDGYGNPYVWQSNNTITDNGTLSFSISETGYPSSTSPFRQGDTFTIKVYSGVLAKNDTLTAVYIATGDINTPTFKTDMNDVIATYGDVTSENTLSLGAQLAFANGAPGVLCVEAAPPLPRRTSIPLYDINANSTDDEEFILPLPFGFVPDTNSSINFFITNPSTGDESQVLPNKWPFYTLDTAGNPTTNQFINSNTAAPSGYAYYYTVVKDDAAVNFQIDGYVNPSNTTSDICTFTSDSITFDSTYVGRKIRIEDASNLANNGLFDITAVSNGALTVDSNNSPIFANFVNGTGVTFAIVDTQGLTVVSGTSGSDGYVVSLGSAQATIGSGSIHFGTVLPGLVNNQYRLRITGSPTSTNNGYFRILSYSSGSNLITIEKTFVAETNIKFEVLDTTVQSYFLVINRNIVPNGYSLRVTAVSDVDAQFFDAGWLNALESLEAFECDIVVPLPLQTISAIFQNTLVHCRTLSNIKNKRERVMFAGAISGLDPDDLIGNTTAAVEDIGVLEGIQGDSVSEILAANIEDVTNYKVYDAFGNTFRCMYFWPDQIIVQTGSSNSTISGYFQAAAGGGYFAGQTNIAMPLTNKVLTGYTISNTKKLSPTVLENLMYAGVTVVQPVAGGGKVVWGRTTTNSGFAEEEEQSIIFIRDKIAKAMRSGFDAFVGLPEDDNIVPQLSAQAIRLLSGFKGQKLITDYRDVIVKRDDVDPRQWNISARVQPNYPVNYIYIRISVGLLS